MPESTAFWISVWEPTLPIKINAPTRLRQKMASQILPLMVKPSRDTEVAMRLKLTKDVSPLVRPRRESHRPETTAPAPVADMSMESPSAPLPNTSSENPGSNSMTWRMSNPVAQSRASK